MVSQGNLLGNVLHSAVELPRGRSRSGRPGVCIVKKQLCAAEVVTGRLGNTASHMGDGQWYTPACFQELHVLGNFRPEFHSHLCSVPSLVYEAMRTLYAFVVRKEPRKNLVYFLLLFYGFKNLFQAAIYPQTTSAVPMQTQWVQRDLLLCPWRAQAVSYPHSGDRSDSGLHMHDKDDLAFLLL